MLPEMRGMWIGPSLSKIEQLCIRSFQDHGHHFVLYCYEPPQGVPAGTECRDAAELIPALEVEPFVKRGNLAAFADWFRWALLLKHGGYWLDMDMVCLAPFDFKEEIVFGYQHHDAPAQGVLRFPPDHPAVRDMLERCIDPNAFRPEDSWRRKVKKSGRRILGNSKAWIDWAEGGGPSGFRIVAKRHNLARLGMPYTVFYPVHNVHFWNLFDDTYASDDDFFAATKAVHLWNEIGRRWKTWDKNGTFHPQSFFERMKRRHGV